MRQRFSHDYSQTSIIIMMMQFKDETLEWSPSQVTEADEQEYEQDWCRPGWRSPNSSPNYQSTGINSHH